MIARNKSSCRMAREQYCRKVLILANLLKPVPRFCNEQKQNAFGEKKLLLGNLLFFRLGTPLCMDQFGWSEEDTVLYFGILVASLGVMSVILFASIGPLTKR